MNPNSSNQRWSKWGFVITPGGTKYPPFAMVKANAARFGRKAFGSASQMKIAIRPDRTVEILVRTEGHNVHEPAYVVWMHEQWTNWAIGGWGLGTSLILEAKLEAGSRQDGTPPDQVIIADAAAMALSIYD